MKTKGAVRIIKKSKDMPPPGVQETGAGANSRQEVRDMTQTVNSWVNEFQQRRDDEGARLVRSFFAGQ